MSPRADQPDTTTAMSNRPIYSSAMGQACVPTNNHCILSGTHSQNKKKACLVLLLNTALSLSLSGPSFILSPNHCCRCRFLGYIYSSLHAAYLVMFVLLLFDWSLTCLQHWSQWTFNTSCRFLWVHFCSVSGCSPCVALRFLLILLLAVISVLASQFFVSCIADFVS